MTDSLEPDVWDAAIVGGGPAGLSAALCLARFGRPVVVLDAGQGRSTHHQVNRNYLGFPGGVRATRLRKLGHRQLADYPHARVRRARVEDLRSTPDGGFTVVGQWGELQARALVIATGVIDHFPHFTGWQSYVGRTMFWCIGCDGYECRDKRLVVAGHTNEAALEAIQLSRLASDITLLTNCDEVSMDTKHRKRLADRGIRLVDDTISDARGADGQLTELLTVGGLSIPLDAMFVVQGATPVTELAVRIGVTLSDNGYLATDVEQKTDVPYVYAAGDVTRLHSHQVSTAVHEGATAASAANYALYPDELK